MTRSNRRRQRWISSNISTGCRGSFLVDRNSGWLWHVPIIRHPKAFLMDEPLSNLDAKLRNSTRIDRKAAEKPKGGLLASHMTRPRP